MLSHDKILLHILFGAFQVIPRISFLLTWIDCTLANRSPMFTIWMIICATDITAFFAIYQHIILINVTHVTYQFFTDLD